MRTSGVRAALFALVVALVASLTRVASAHAVGVSRGEYLVDESGVRVTLTFARADVMALVASLDANKDGLVMDAEVLAARPEIERAVFGGIAIDADGVSCTPRLESVSLTEQDGLDARGSYACRKARTDHFSLKFLGSLGRGHRHLVHVTGAKSPSGASALLFDDVCFRGHSEFEVRVPEADSATQPENERANPAPSWFPFFRMGVEHILTGYDHLVFLFGLVLVGGRLRAILAVVTAFTLAHSVTLVLATLGIWTPSPSIIEPAIALSIAYVGVEDFFVTSAEGRWRITFPFGLVHGFGFAGALEAIGLVRSQIPVALVSFNVGVEAGQLALLAILLPVIYGLRRYAWFRERGVRGLSALIVLVGLVWFVMRVRG